MEANFWKERWATQQIGFHLNEANPLLVKHISALGLNPPARIFLPLCGKTLDIGWLLSQGHHVAGAELVESAVISLFEELRITPAVEKLGALKVYRTKNLDLYVGDIFELKKDLLGPVDGVFDRAALVALPLEMRQKYTAHLRSLTQQAPQLLVTFDYDQNLVPGPPFSVTAAEVRDHYPEATFVEGHNVSGGLKGIAATESVWLIKSSGSLD